MLRLHFGFSRRSDAKNTLILLFINLKMKREKIKCSKNIWIAINNWLKHSEIFAIKFYFELNEKKKKTIVYTEIGSSTRNKNIKYSRFFFFVYLIEEADIRINCHLRNLYNNRPNNLLLWIIYHRWSQQRKKNHFSRSKKSVIIFLANFVYSTPATRWRHNE